MGIEARVPRALSRKDGAETGAGARGGCGAGAGGFPAGWCSTPRNHFACWWVSLGEENPKKGRGGKSFFICTEKQTERPRWALPCSEVRGRSGPEAAWDAGGVRSAWGALDAVGRGDSGQPRRLADRLGSATVIIAFLRNEREMGYRISRVECLSNHPIINHSQ